MEILGPVALAVVCVFCICYIGDALFVASIRGESCGGLWLSAFISALCLFWGIAYSLAHIIKAIF